MSYNSKEEKRREERNRKMIIDLVIAPLALLNDYLTESMNYLIASNLFLVLPLVLGSLSCFYVASLPPLESSQEANDEEKKNAVLQALNVMSMDHFAYTHSNDPAVQSIIQDLQKQHTFGIEKYKTGPFLPLTNLNFQNGKLYYEQDGETRSVASKIHEVRNQTKTRWINYLCFVKNDAPKEKPVFLKEYIQETHGLWFS
jgi:hypothetical protein